MKKIALVVLLVLVVAAGCSLGKKTAVLYTDEDYKFNLIVSKECEKYFSVKLGELSETTIDALKVYDVYAPLSTEWNDSLWFFYNILTQEAYDKFPSGEPPGKPEIILTLESGNLLVRWNPQDRPGDQPAECEFNTITAEKI